MKRIFWTVLALLLLSACGNDDMAPGEAQAGPQVDGVALIDIATGQAVPGFETLDEGAVIDARALEAAEVTLHVRTASQGVSRVELTLDDQRWSDESAPYTFEVSQRAFSVGEHTLSATAFDPSGAPGPTLTRRFSVVGSGDAPGPTPAPPQAGVNRYLYVFQPTTIKVYDIDRSHKLVKTLRLPAKIGRIWGAVAHAPSQRLYIAYNSHPGIKPTQRGLIAYDLVEERVVWDKQYRPWTDSPALTRDGQTIYLSSGEATHAGTFWFVLDAKDGRIKDTIDVYQGAHNTIVGLSDKYVYMGSVRYPYLVMADTQTNEIVRRIGPFRDGIRPFTVNGKETLAFVNVNRFLGFEVGDVATGKVLHSVRVEGYPEGPWKSPLQVQSHGVALTPDEREVWVVDGKSDALHIFDVRGLPAQKPVYKESIALRQGPVWVQFSRDGRFAYSSGGEVIDTATRKIVSQTASAKVRVQIDFKNGKPTNAYVRYGLGYVTD